MLSLAAFQDEAKVLRVLLDAGADISAKNKDSDGIDGWTALHQAARAGRAGHVKILLARGANISVRTTDGSTPLHSAASGGQ